MKKYYPLLLMLCLSQGWADELSPRTPEYTVPHLPEQPGKLLPREGTIWVQGTLLASPCELDESIPPRILQTHNAISVALVNCGEDDDRSRASVPVRVTQGMVTGAGNGKATRLLPGSNFVLLDVVPGVKALRMEIDYE